MKYIAILVCYATLVGCTSATEELEEEVYNNCPIMCEKCNQVWSGLVKVRPDGVVCVCEEPR